MKYFVWACSCSKVSIPGFGVGLAEPDGARPRHLLVVLQYADVIPIGDGAGDLAGVVALLIGNSMVQIQFTG
jgi:hypothetical protein